MFFFWFFLSFVIDLPAQVEARAAYPPSEKYSNAFDTTYDHLPHLIAVAFHPQFDALTATKSASKTYEKIQPLVEQLGLTIHYSPYLEAPKVQPLDTLQILIKAGRASRMLVVGYLSQVTTKEEIPTNQTLKDYLLWGCKNLWKENCEVFSAMVLNEIEAWNKLREADERNFLYLLGKKEDSNFNSFNDPALRALRVHPLVYVAGPALSDRLQDPFLIPTNALTLYVQPKHVERIRPILQMYAARYDAAEGLCFLDEGVGLGIFQVMRELAETQVVYVAPYFPLQVGVNELNQQVDNP